MQKNKNEHIFSKREDTFVHTKRFQLKIKAEENISCFSKKGKVVQKNTLFFFCFLFWCGIFLHQKIKKRNKTADDT